MFIDMRARVGPSLTTFLEFDLMTISAHRRGRCLTRTLVVEWWITRGEENAIPSRYSPPPAASNGNLYDKALVRAKCRYLPSLTYCNPASANNRPLGLESELNDVSDTALDAASSVVCVAKGRTYGNIGKDINPESHQLSILLKFLRHLQEQFFFIKTSQLPAVELDFELPTVCGSGIASLLGYTSVTASRRSHANADDETRLVIREDLEAASNNLKDGKGLISRSSRLRADGSTIARKYVHSHESCYAHLHSSMLKHDTSEEHR